MPQAIRTLKQQNYDRKGAASLLQDLHVPPTAKRTIDAFLARDMEDAHFCFVAQVV